MIVALLNQKGGVGKTTIALHLAGEWARRGQRVAFADTAQTGRLVGELDRDSAAAREIAALATEIGRIAP